MTAQPIPQPPIKRANNTTTPQNSTQHPDQGNKRPQEASTNLAEGAAAMDYSRKKLVELREMLQERHLPTSGNKAALNARLQENDQTLVASGINSLEEKKRE